MDQSSKVISLAGISLNEISTKLISGDSYRTKARNLFSRFDENFYDLSGNLLIIQSETVSRNSGNVLSSRIPKLTFGQLSVVAELEEFFERHVDHEELESLISSSFLGRMKDLKPSDKKVQVLDAWEGFNNLSFDMLEQQLRALITTFQVYLNVDKRFFGFQAVGLIEHLHRKFEEDFICRCRLLKGIALLADYIDETLYRMKEWSLQFEPKIIDAPISRDGVNLSQIDVFLPKAISKYVKRAEQVCIC